MPRSVSLFLVCVTALPAGLGIAAGDDPGLSLLAALSIPYALFAWLLAFVLFHRRADAGK